MPFFRAFIPLLAFLSTGCGSYAVPGNAADLSLFADREIRPAYVRKPESPLPARIATVRVQAPGYRDAYGGGRYSVVTVREIEQEGDLAKIAAMPEITGIAPLNRLMIGNPDFKSDVELRRAAATLGADMLLIYTFETQFQVDDGMRPLSVVTLGLFPTKVATVTTTAASVLMDVRSGYIYATGESTVQRKPLANAWTDDDAVDTSRRENEREAYVKLVGDFERIWPQVVRERRLTMARP
jgi:hypothetical protein